MFLTRRGSRRSCITQHRGVHESVTTHATSSCGTSTAICAAALGCQRPAAPLEHAPHRDRRRRRCTTARAKSTGRPPGQLRHRACRRPTSSSARRRCEVVTSACQARILQTRPARYAGKTRVHVARAVPRRLFDAARRVLAGIDPLLSHPGWRPYPTNDFSSGTGSPRAVRRDQSSSFTAELEAVVCAPPSRSARTYATGGAALDLSLRVTRGLQLSPWLRRTMRARPRSKLPLPPSILGYRSRWSRAELPEFANGSGRRWCCPSTRDPRAAPRAALSGVRAGAGRRGGGAVGARRPGPSAMWCGAARRAAAVVPPQPPLQRPSRLRRMPRRRADRRRVAGARGRAA